MEKMKCIMKHNNNKLHFKRCPLQTFQNSQKLQICISCPNYFHGNQISVNENSYTVHLAM